MTHVVLVGMMATGKSTAGRLLDWTPQVALADGLERTVAYFREEIAAQG